MSTINRKWFVDNFSPALLVRSKVTFVVFILATMLLILCYLLFNAPYITGKSDIDEESGLYSIKDKITVLHEKNFDEIYDSTKAYLVQFYNSWCGHCINFSPVYKTFAADVYNWRNISTLAAVDCADDHNTQLCRDFEIMRYPTIQFFHPFTNKRNTAGIDFTKKTSVPFMRNQLADMLETSQREGWGPEDWPYMQPIEAATLNEIRTIGNVSDDEILFVVVESNVSHLGIELILDTCFIPKIAVRRTFNVRLELPPATVKSTSDPALYCQVPLSLTNGSSSSRDNAVLSLNLNNDNSRESAYRVLTTYLNTNFNRTIPTDLHNNNNSDYNDEDRYEMLSSSSSSTSLSILSSSLPTSTEQQQLSTTGKFSTIIDPTIIVNHVYFIDLENCLRFALFHEVALKPFFDQDAQDALYNFLQVLSLFMPYQNPNLPLFLNALKLYVRQKSDNALLTGEQFKRTATELEAAHSPVFTSPTGTPFYGCRGSTNKYRGYPCSMWMLAHTLTVRANTVDGKQVLLAFEGYMKHFFGCTECAENFLKITPTIRTNVTTLNDSVLWLWQAHNMANERLKSDRSADPKFPKIQFPSRDACPDCYRNNNSSTNDIINRSEALCWDVDNVLKFLRTMYLNVIFITPNNLMTNMMNSAHSSSRKIVDFNGNNNDAEGLFNSVSDANIGIGLYILFMLALVAYVIKVAFIRRKPKHFRYNSNSGSSSSNTTSTRHHDFAFSKV